MLKNHIERTIFQIFILLTRMFIIFFFIILIKCTVIENSQTQQRLLILSLDGFRYDFIQRYDLENFKSFINADQASKAPFMAPQFTTLTFPNHWSLVTGSYVETHGIVANVFFDPKLNESFTRDDKNYSNLKWWNATKPVWFSTVEKGLKTGVYFWPGSDALFSNSSLFKRFDYNRSITFDNKIDKIIEWLNENYTFVALYHNQPDAVGHRYGIDTAEFNQTIKDVDRSFGYLIEKLKQINIYDSDNFNLIIVSDHGLVNINKHVILDDYINGNDAVIWSESGNLIHFKPLINHEDFLNKLKNIPNTKAYYKKDIPEKLYYRNNHRIGDVVLISEEGVGMILMYNKTLKNGQNPPENYADRKAAFISDSEKAGHGFDQIYQSMRAIFLVRGSQFKKNFTSPNHIENIDVYPLVCHLLELDCQIRNGSFQRIQTFLNSPPNNNNSAMLSKSEFLFTILIWFKLFLFPILL